LSPLIHAAEDTGTTQDKSRPFKQTACSQN